MTCCLCQNIASACLAVVIVIVECSPGLQLYSKAGGACTPLQTNSSLLITSTAYLLSQGCQTNDTALPFAERPESAASNHARIAVGASAFDILPTRGVLQAGQSRTVEFAYYARPGQKASTSAVCDVEGGPTYALPVSADSNAIK